MQQMCGSRIKRQSRCLRKDYNLYDLLYAKRVCLLEIFCLSLCATDIQSFSTIMLTTDITHHVLVYKYKKHNSSITQTLEKKRTNGNIFNIWFYSFILIEVSNLLAYVTIQGTEQFKRTYTWSFALWIIIAHWNKHKEVSKLGTCTLLLSLTTDFSIIKFIYLANTKSHGLIIVIFLIF